MIARREMNSALTLMLATLFSEDFTEARPAQQNTQGHMR
jgi:hypothetical protein